jgi:Rho-binding antiterminator
MISCQQYDYIEIVCLYHYPLLLDLKSGQIVEGIAANTVLNEKREECLEINSHGTLIKIVLDDIATLNVTIKNPHIDTLSFV